jgi:hypothetical protein
MGGDLEGSGRGLSGVLLGGTDRTELCQTKYWAIMCVATLCCRLHVSKDYFPVEGWRNRSFHGSGTTMLFQLLSLEFCLVTLL